MQPTPPKNRGAPEARCNCQPLSCRSGFMYGVTKVMKNDQPELLQKYMKLRHHRVGLLRMADQDIGAETALAALPGSGREAPAGSLADSPPVAPTMPVSFS